MKLIADSGSTKTHWVLLKDNQSVAEIRSQGINPFFQNEERIRQVVKMEVAYPLRSQGVDLEQVNELFFYGAGLREEMKGKVTQILQHVFPASTIEAQSDLLGAARALCQHDEGVACILGTGSNSGLYDGSHIVANVPPLGFILGDEGSGAVLGKLFVGWPISSTRCTDSRCPTATSPMPPNSFIGISTTRRCANSWSTISELSYSATSSSTNGLTCLSMPWAVSPISSPTNGARLSLRKTACRVASYRLPYRDWWPSMPPDSSFLIFIRILIF